MQMLNILPAYSLLLGKYIAPVNVFAAFNGVEISHNKSFE